MTDRKIRNLERAWKSEGENEARLLLERVRSEDLTRLHLEAAARLGYPAATLAVDSNWTVLPGPKKEELSGMGRFDACSGLIAALGTEAVLRAMGALVRLFPLDREDVRVRVEATHALLDAAPGRLPDRIRFPFSDDPVVAGAGAIYQQTSLVLSRSAPLENVLRGAAACSPAFDPSQETVVVAWSEAVGSWLVSQVPPLPALASFLAALEARRGPKHPW